MKLTGEPFPLRLKLGAIALAAMGVFGVALFGGWIPGLHPNYAEPTTIEVGGVSYYWTDFSIPWPLPPANSTAPSSVGFHNITFEVWVTDWYDLAGGGIVHGNGTEPNGTTYGFELGGAPLGSNASSIFVSPHHAFGAIWSGQTFVELLVRAPLAAS